MPTKKSIKKNAKNACLMYVKLWSKVQVCWDKDRTIIKSRAAVVHLNFQAGSTFPAPVCTVPSSMDRTSRCNKVDAVKRYALYRLNLRLLKEQRCVKEAYIWSNRIQGLKYQKSTTSGCTNIGKKVCGKNLFTLLYVHKSRRGEGVSV